MAEFAKCHICKALMVDDPDNRRDHLADHANTKRRIDNLGRDNTKYLQQIAELKNQLKGYGAQLAQHPISASPESIVINDIPDDEIDQYDDYQTVSTYTDDITPPATLDNPTAGEPAETPTDTIYPAIDREDDDLDARIARQTGVIPAIP